jgi:hypothetical protein
MMPSSPNSWIEPWLTAPDALVAVGLAGATEEELEAQLKAAVAARSVELTYLAPTAASRLSATALEGLWLTAVSALDRGSLDQAMRVRVNTPPVTDEPGGEAVSATGDLALALQSATEVQSVCLVDRTRPTLPQFEWPLRVAFGASQSHLRALAEDYARPHLLTVQGRPSRLDPADLLVIGLGDEDEARRTAPGMTVQLIDDVTPARSGVLDSLRRVVSPLTAVVSARGNEGQFLAKLFDALAHNYTPDRAVGHAAHPFGHYLVSAHPDYLDAARVTAAVIRVRQAAEVAFARDIIDRDAFLAAAAPLSEMAMLPEDLFTSEGLGADESALRVRATRSVLAKADLWRDGVLRSVAPMDRTGREPPSSTRRLQAQVSALFESPTLRRRTLAPDTVHQIRIRVGSEDLDWINAPMPLPDIAFAPDDRMIPLDIRLFVPALMDHELAGQVFLGRTGDSTTTDFLIYVPHDMQVFEAIIRVSHDGTPLQTALLRSLVATQDDIDDEHALALLRSPPSDVDLDYKVRPDLALVVAEDTVFVDFPGKERAPISLPGLGDVVDGLRDLLFDKARALDSLEQPLLSKNGTQLIRALARQGAFLRRRILGTEPHVIRRVDVASPSSGTFLPVEFFYDLPQPTRTAELCRMFASSDYVPIDPANTGRVDELTGCSPACEAVNDQAFVCPSGFWALRTVIERQIQSTTDPDCIHPQPHAGRFLPLVKEIVFAASDRVNTSTGLTRIDETVDELRKVADKVHVAPDWDGWKELVSKPALLLALPHTVTVDRVEQALEVGPKEGGDPCRHQLALIDVGRDHVNPSNGPGPIMVFLGCDIANPQAEFQDFVREFRCNGASLVLGTLTSTLGPQAAPFAVALVKALWASRGEEPVGELLRRVRHTMLRLDNPMALAVSAFGAADWVFETGRD